VGLLSSELRSALEQLSLSLINCQVSLVVLELFSVLSLESFDCLTQAKLRSLLLSVKECIVELEQVDFVLEEELVGKWSELVLEYVLVARLLDEIDDAPARVRDKLHVEVLFNC
jgi:hypothetical protein